MHTNAEQFAKGDYNYKHKDTGSRDCTVINVLSLLVSIV